MGASCSPSLRRPGRAQVNIGTFPVHFPQGVAIDTILRWQTCWTETDLIRLKVGIEPCPSRRGRLIAARRTREWACGGWARAVCRNWCNLTSSYTSPPGANSQKRKVERGRQDYKNRTKKGQRAMPSLPKIHTNEVHPWRGQKTAIQKYTLKCEDWQKLNQRIGYLCTCTWRISLNLQSQCTTWLHTYIHLFDNKGPTGLWHVAIVL